MTLLEVLREECGVTSPKDGCSPQGTCGCCTVMFDGRPALACLKSPADAEGHEIRTLEGVPEEKRRLLAAAFVREGAVQCGFCTPGIMMRAVSRARSRQGARPRRRRARTVGPPVPLHRVQPHRRRGGDRRRRLGDRRAAAGRRPAAAAGVRRGRAAGGARGRHLRAALPRRRLRPRRQAVHRRHARPRDAPRGGAAVGAPACAGAPARPGAGAGDAGRGACAHRGGRARRAVRRHDRQGLAGVRRRRRDNALRRRRPRDGHRRLAVPRPPRGRGGGGRLRDAPPRHLARGGAAPRRPAPARARQRPRGVRVLARRHRRGAGRTRPTSSRSGSRRSGSSTRFWSPRRAWQSRVESTRGPGPGVRGRGSTAATSRQGVLAGPGGARGPGADRGGARSAA